MQQYQTLDEFLREPFGRQDLLDKITDYESRYQIYLRDNKIRLVAYTEVEGSYYLHVTVPSESAKEESYRYDVVLRFFTTSDRIRKESSLRNYYVQFFSNKPWESGTFKVISKWLSLSRILKANFSFERIPSVESM